MTGFAALDLTEQGDSAAQWSGISKIIGPQWSRLPILTIGLLGVQVLWTVEMSYGQFSLRMDIGLGR
jgi:solute carrier family 45 protein 1/2/4